MGLFGTKKKDKTNNNTDSNNKTDNKTNNSDNNKNNDKNNKEPTSPTSPTTERKKGISIFKKKETVDNKKPTTPPPTKEIDPVDEVVKKLLKCNPRSRKSDPSVLKVFAKRLVYEKELQTYYLNSDFASTQEILHDLDEEHKKQTENINNNNGVKGVFASASNSNELQFENEEEDSEIPETEESNQSFFEEDEQVNVEQLKQESEDPTNITNSSKISKYVKAKLIIVEISRRSSERSFRKLMSPILTKFEISQTFGLFHTALVVGPWYFEWNNSSLCIPRKCYSGAALIATDLSLPNGVMKIELATAINKLTPIITDWNSKKIYHRMNCNCQHFVDLVVKELGFDLSSFDNTLLGSYFKKMREQGYAKVEVSFRPELRETFKIKDQTINFDSHLTLDKFVISLVLIDSLFEERYPQEWSLLKSFDRAYWLRFLKDRDNPKWQPINDIDFFCPFKDPTETLSFKKDWL